MKAHVVKAELPIHEARDDMLAGVVLHAAMALLPVDPAGEALPRREGPVGFVEDPSLLLVHVQHPGLADEAGVGRLAAPFGEKGGPVQGQGPALLRLLAGEDHRLKFPQMAVDIIEFFRHGRRLHTRRGRRPRRPVLICFLRAAEGGGPYGS